MIFIDSFDDVLQILKEELKKDYDFFTLTAHATNFANLGDPRI